MAPSGRGHQDGVEITSIGVLYRGPLEKKYWSSSRGKEKYPYPIGYQATRWHGGHCYFMEVSEGPRGPSFMVKCEEGITCSGQTPSAVWEEILKKKHVGAKRVLVRSSCTSIDGAEMFGFTNPLVQRLCRDLVVSASGAAENSNSSPAEEIKERKEDAKGGRRRKAEPPAESSEKSRAKGRWGKKSTQSPSSKSVADEVHDNMKHLDLNVTPEPAEETQETKIFRKEKLKRPARESLESSQENKALEGKHTSTSGNANVVTQHQPEDQDLPRSKRSRLPKPKAVPDVDEIMENVGSSHKANSRNFKGETKPIKGEDKPKGRTPKDSERQKNSVKASQGSSTSDYPVSHTSGSTANKAPQISPTSDPEDALEDPQRNASSRKKKAKIARAQKGLDTSKRKKYDTEVDLTQSQGFLSVDLVCPSAEDVKVQTPAGLSGEKFGEVGSEKDGYLMLLAASKLAEVEQSNVTKEKTGDDDVRRKRPLSDVDSSKAPKVTPDVVPSQPSSKVARLNVEHVDANNLTPSSSNASLEGTPLPTGSATTRVDLPDINCLPETVLPSDELLTEGQLNEDLISHDKPNTMDKCRVEGERSQMNSNLKRTGERFSGSIWEGKEDGNFVRQISEDPTGNDKEAAVNDQTTGNASSSLKTLQLPADDFSVEGKVSGVEKTAFEEEWAVMAEENKRELLGNATLGNGKVDCQRGAIFSVPADSVAIPTLSVSDPVAPKENTSHPAQNHVHSGEAEPAVSAQGVSCLQVSESPVVKAEENNDQKQTEVSVFAGVSNFSDGDRYLICKVTEGSSNIPIPPYLQEEVPSSPATASVSIVNTTGSEYGPQGTCDLGLRGEITGGGFEGFEIRLSKDITDEQTSPVIDLNRTMTSIVEADPELLDEKPQLFENSVVMKEGEPDMEASYRELKQFKPPADLDTGPGNDVQNSNPSQHLLSTSECGDDPPESLKRLTESLAGGIQSSSVISDVLTVSEKETSNLKLDNDMMEGVPPENEEKLQDDIIARSFPLGTSYSHSTEDSGGQSRNSLAPTSTASIRVELVDPLMLDPCPAAERSPPDTTDEVHTAVAVAVKVAESAVEPNLANGSSDHLNLTAVSQEETKLCLLDDSYCKRTDDYSVTGIKCSSNGYLDVDMGPVLSRSREEDKRGKLDPAPMDREQEAVSEGKPEQVISNEEGSAAVLIANELVSVHSDACLTDQVFQPEGFTVAVNGISELTEPTVKQSAETEVIFCVPSVFETVDPVDRDEPSGLEKVSPEAEESSKLTPAGASGTDVVSTTYSAEAFSPIGSEPQDLEAGGGVEDLVSASLVSNQVGCEPYQKQKSGATGEGETPVQGDSSLALPSGQLYESNLVSGEDVDPVSFQAPELEEIKQLGSTSQCDERAVRVATSVSVDSPQNSGLETRHAEANPEVACPTSDQDLAIMAAVSPLPSQTQRVALSQDPSQKNEFVSASRELTTSIITSLLPEALPLLATSKGNGNATMSVAGESGHALETGARDVGASVSLVRSGQSDHPVQVANLAGNLEASGIPPECKTTETGGNVQQLVSVSDLEEPRGNDGSSVRDSDGGCPMDMDLGVHKGDEINTDHHFPSPEKPLSDGVFQVRISGACPPMEIDAGVQKDEQSGSPADEVLNQEDFSVVLSPEANIVCQVAADLEGEVLSEVCRGRSNSLTTAENGQQSMHFCDERKAVCDIAVGAEEDVFENCQSIWSSRAFSSDFCRDNPAASQPDALLELAEEQLVSCVTSQTITSHNDTQDSVKDPGASLDVNASPQAAMVQETDSVVAKVSGSAIENESGCTEANMKSESTYEQVPGCGHSYTLASEALDSEQPESVVVSETDARGAMLLSVDTRVEADVPLLEISEAQLLTTNKCEMQDVRKVEVVSAGGTDRGENKELVVNAVSRSLSPRMLESKLGASEGDRSDVLPSGASCVELDHSLISTKPPTGTELSEKVSHVSSEDTGCPERVIRQPAFLQKLEMPITIEHPFEVSALVMNVRSKEVRLCVCCGTGSERTLSVFEVVSTGSGDLEHQLVAVLETSYNKHYAGTGRINVQWESEQSGIRFTPDGKRLILLGCFSPRHAGNPGSHGYHGIRIISLGGEGCQSSTLLESEGPLLCLDVREQRRVIAAGEDGAVSFWEFDPDWRTFKEKVSLPKATNGGVSVTSVTSLQVLPHLQHMVVGCNPSGLFALWDMDSGTLLYSCQMFEHLLLNVSLVDAKSMNWEERLFQKESSQEECKQLNERTEVKDSVASLPPVCLLTMVMQKGNCILKSEKDHLSLTEQKRKSGERVDLILPEGNSSDTGAVADDAHVGSSNRDEQIPEQPTADRTSFHPRREVVNLGDEGKELTSTDLGNFMKEPGADSGPCECKFVVMRDGHFVCGNALSDRPTSIASMGRYGVMGTADGLVHIWDAETGQKVLQLDDLKGSAVVCVATCSSPAVLATAGENKQVNLYLQKEVFASATTI
ncbi:hypothetical protein R1sor_018328 [Riccia sorocarpa]|uniref:Uncharacterized protein n=1 Tax=Riccia sorocarpa TaxID=122646 RepID=A0ABD3IAE5_9MARC